MLIDFKGLKTESYDIPPFQINQGEIVLLHLYSGSHYYPLKSTLVDILTKKISNEQATIHQPFTFVAPFKEPALRKLCYPVTVEEYISKNAGPDKIIAHNIYSEGQITGNTRINTLSFLHRKLLSLYVTVSKTQFILFDLDGLCPQNADSMYNIVKDFVKTGVSAIHLDWNDEYKSDCSNYIELQWRVKPGATNTIQEGLCSR